MGNLRDQLLKANLLSKKDARRLAHEERVKRSEVGREGLEQEQQARTEELAAARDAERDKQQARQQADEDARRQAEELAACEDLLARAPRPTPHGRSRFYFELDDGTLPWLDLTETELKRVLSGELAVAWPGGCGCHDYALLELAKARRVAAMLPDRIAWWPPAAGRTR